MHADHLEASSLWLYGAFQSGKPHSQGIDAVGIGLLVIHWHQYCCSDLEWS
jgi:hypothetical protein